MMLAEAERAPDAIEPAIGYRAWSFAIKGRSAWLFSIAAPRDAADSDSDWDGAASGWVAASCRLAQGYVSRRSTTACVCEARAAEGLHPLWCVACGPHPAPQEECSCGFYAMKTLSSVEPWGGPHTILGRVELAGKVIEHEFGYRAQHARVTELIPILGTGSNPMLLADRLGLPLAAPADLWVTHGGHI
jgi:hypothetical protein